MKKNFVILWVLLWSGFVFGQDFSKINADLKLLDSLTFDTEIRVYQHYNTTNYSCMLRIYEDDTKKWHAKFYEHFDEIPSEGVKLKAKWREIKPRHDLDSIVTSFERSGILNLPSFDKIRWKFKKRGEIEKIVDTRRGKTTSYYTYSSSISWPLDGYSYEVQAKIGTKTNEFRFSNPDVYYEKYPEVDELLYINEIMTLIQGQFGIWKD